MNRYQELIIESQLNAEVGELIQETLECIDSLGYEMQGEEVSLQECFDALEWVYENEELTELEKKYVEKLYEDLIDPEKHPHLHAYIQKLGPEAADMTLPGHDMEHDPKDLAFANRAAKALELAKRGGAKLSWGKPGYVDKRIGRHGGRNYVVHRGAERFHNSEARNLWRIRNRLGDVTFQVRRNMEKRGFKVRPLPGSLGQK